MPFLTRPCAVLQTAITSRHSASYHPPNARRLLTLHILGTFPLTAVSCGIFCLDTKHLPH